MKQLSTLIMVPDSASRARTISVLLQAGISTKGCSTPLELFGMLNEEHYDIVVLDVSVLGELGFALIARLRGSSELGVIVKGEDMPVETRLRCLQSGADAALAERSTTGSWPACSWRWRAACRSGRTSLPGTWAWS